MKIQTILNKISTYHHKNCDLLSWKFLPVIIKPWNYDQENLNLLSWKSRLIVIKISTVHNKILMKKANVHNKILIWHDKYLERS